MIGNDPVARKILGDRFDVVDVPYTPHQIDDTLMSYTRTGYYHVHGASFLYPDKADPVTITSSAASWSETGALTEVIPADTIVKDFDLHWASINEISATLYGVVDIFAGGVGEEIKIGSVDVSRTTNQAREDNMPVQIPQQAANTRISCRFTDSTTSSRTVKVKFYGHVYGTSLA